MSTKETCPKCGEKLMGFTGTHVQFLCFSRLPRDGGDIDQSDRCRISELERENERLRDCIGIAFEELDMEKQSWMIEVGSEQLAGNIVKENYAKGRLNGIEVALQSLSTLSTLLKGGKTE